MRKYQKYLLLTTICFSTASLAGWNSAESDSIHPEYIITKDDHIPSQLITGNDSKMIGFPIAKSFSAHLYFTKGSKSIEINGGGLYATKALKQQVFDLANEVDTEEVKLISEDINGDGFNDLFFITSPGIVNCYGDYFLFNAKEGGFIHIGHYPNLNIDKKSGKISSYERNGHAGRLYREAEYRFEGNKLLTTSVTEQILSEDGEKYIKKRYLLKNGKLELASSTLIKR